MTWLLNVLSHIKAFLSLIRLGVHFIYGFIIIFSHRIRYGKHWFYSTRGVSVVQRWMWQGSRILGLNIQTSGAAYSQSAVLVSNHISWLDIVAIAATTPVTFVSKNDLERWPFVGKLAGATGTVFIKRGSVFAVHKTLNHLNEINQSGCKTAFFPEGTTTIGESVKRFNSGLFESANSAACPVQPIAISYFYQGKPDRVVAPYVDDDHFMAHLWNLFRVGTLQVQLDFLDEIPANTLSRQELAAASRKRIVEVLETSRMIDEDYPLEVCEAGYVVSG